MDKVDFSALKAPDSQGAVSREGKRALPTGVVRKSELSARLDALEQNFRTSGRLELSQLRELEPSIRYWSDRTSHLAQLNRYAGLLKRAGDSPAALKILEFAHAMCPGHSRVAAALCDLLVASGRLLDALKIISPHVGCEHAEVQVLIAAARAYHRVGDWERGNQLYQRAARTEPARSGEYLDALNRSGRKEEALAEASRILATKPQDPRVCFGCFATLLKAGVAPPLLDEARKWLFTRAEKTSAGAIWRARAHRLEGDIEGGLKELSVQSEEPHMVRERALFALAGGYVGRDAKIILAARPMADSALAESISQAELLLRACGTSLEQSAETPARHVRVPESIFEIVTAAPPPSGNARGRSGLVMIVPTLSGGGAERIVATSFRRWVNDARFGWAKLYVSDLDRESQADFYLPLTGIERSDVVVLDGDENLIPPWGWLGPARGQRAQRIYRRLMEDRPAVVHATLDLLNSGLAAIAAGVPRIVLHIHNMRPAELGAKDTERMRECYRALLKRPEVSVVGCARACIEDHLDWLGLSDESKFHTIHNGLDVRSIIAASDPETRVAQRAVFGLSPDDLVVGTAFRFAELKQPFLWVDAAERVLSRRPGCKFVMFGDGELHSAVNRYIAQKNLTAQFALPGRVKDIHRRLAILDLFVLSSRTEALPNALLEAQAAGIPVIAFDVGGVREAMLDGITGRLVREQTAEALSDEILAVLRSTEWRCNATSKAQSFVREGFGVERMLRELATILLGGGQAEKKVAVRNARPAASAT